MTRRRVIGSIPRGFLVHDPALGILWVLPDPKGESDPAVSSAIALRNRATLEGVCPGCGATEQPGLCVIVIEHEAECPAGTEQLRALVSQSQRVRHPRPRGGNS